MGRRALAAAGLLSVLVAVPLVMFEFAGPPSLDGLPDLEGIRRAIELRWVPVEWAMQVLALSAWTLWAYLLLTLLLRIAGSLQARHGTEGRLWAASEALTWSPVKLLVDFALGAILVNSASSQSPARAGELGWARTIAHQVAVVREHEAPSPEGAVDRPRKDRSSTEEGSSHERGAARHGRGANGTYVVRPGDSLWSIAETKLNDPYRWREIWRLNHDRSMPDGERLLRPGFIRPGWTLRLPDNGKEDKAGPGRARAVAKRERCDDDRLDYLTGKHSSTPPIHDADRSEPSPLAESPVASEASDSSTHRVELPSGTAVAAAFIAGLAAAAAAAQLRARRRRIPGSAPRGWPKPTGQHDLKARLQRTLFRSEQGAEVESSTQPIEIQRLTGNPSGILLGHREGTPIHARAEGGMVTLAGDEGEVRNCFLDLGVHSLVSHRAEFEVWTTTKLGLAAVSGCRAFDDTARLLAQLEIELIKRRRMLAEEDLADWETHQREWADDPLPLVLALVPSLESERPDRVAAIADQGRILGLVVFVYAPSADALELRERELHPKGSAQQRFGQGPIQTVRFASVDRDEALSSLRTNASPAKDDATDEEETISAPPQAVTDQARITVRLFGPPYFAVGGREIKEELQPKSRETLTFLLLRPEGASREQAIEALWPETDPERGKETLGKQLRRIRPVLRSALRREDKFVARSGDIYRVQPELFDVDVWEFDRLLEEANRDTDRAAELLRTAIDLCRGRLLEGAYYDWAEPLRSHFHRRFVDAMVRLADIHSAQGSHEDAVNVLEKAITVEPFGEYIYRKAMTSYADLGRRNEIWRLYRRLEAVLAEDLDAEPEEETVTLKDKLLDGLSRKSLVRAPDSRRQA